MQLFQPLAVDLHFLNTGAKLWVCSQPGTQGPSCNAAAPEQVKAARRTSAHCVSPRDQKRSRDDVLGARGLTGEAQVSPLTSGLGPPAGTQVVGGGGDRGQAARPPRTPVTGSGSQRGTCLPRPRAPRRPSAFPSHRRASPPPLRGKSPPPSLAVSWRHLAGPAARARRAQAAPGGRGGCSASPAHGSPRPPRRQRRSSPWRQGGY